jgi:hypothetical protein
MFAGIMMLLLNVGSRYITHEYSSNDEEYHQNIFMRRIAIFAVCFVGTRNIVISILLTAGFVVLAGGLFRGKGDVSREGMTNSLAVPGAAVVLSSLATPPYGGAVDPSPPLFNTTS